MGNNVFGFVVLHYLDFEMTKQCVLNILENYKKYNIKIVIVDNASQNGSGEKLKNYFEFEHRVTVIITEENLGFANGNNVGYEYLKKFEYINFIIILNNDVLIKQNNFLDTIVLLYQRKHFSVLGPDIYNPIEKKHQNPSRIEPLNLCQIKSLYRTLNERNNHYTKYFIKRVFLNLIKRNGNFIKNSEGYDREQTNVVLHGACYIFSEDYILKRNKAFNTETFLYLEEEILYFECVKSGLRILYSPEIIVYHLEDVSTKRAFKTSYFREKMITENKLQSTEVLLKLVSNMEKTNEKKDNKN